QDHAVGEGRGKAQGGPSGRAHSDGRENNVNDRRARLHLSVVYHAADRGIKCFHGCRIPRNVTERPAGGCFRPPPPRSRRARRTCTASPKTSIPCSRTSRSPARSSRSCCPPSPTSAAWGAAA